MKENRKKLPEKTTHKKPSLITVKISNKKMEILMMKLILRINYNTLISKFKKFEEFLQMICPLILNFQKLNCLKLYNQEDLSLSKYFLDRVEGLKEY